MRGLSRQVVGAIAESQGNDPSQWLREPTSVMTWGGYPYNFLVRGVLIASGHSKRVVADAFGLSEVDPGFDITPESVLTLAKDVFENRRLPRAIVERFREGTQFLGNLSPALQREEARRSVPVEGFMEWLEDCRR
jgi:hypothetical protein